MIFPTGQNANGMAKLDELSKRQNKTAQPQRFKRVTQSSAVQVANAIDRSVHIPVYVGYVRSIVHAAAASVSS